MANKFGLSPALAAVTLIAFANGAPDLLASLSSGAAPGGEMVSLGGLYGGFMFCTTLVVANVIFNSPTPHIYLPKIVILKELIFYLISVIIVVSFGLMQKTGYWFIGVYLSVYVIYIVLSVIVDKMTPSTDDQK